jgi:hypothetical protein
MYKFGGYYYRTTVTNVLDFSLDKLLHSLCHIQFLPHKNQNSKSILEQ